MAGSILPIISRKFDGVFALNIEAKILCFDWAVSHVDTVLLNDKVLHFISHMLP